MYSHVVMFRLKDAERVDEAAAMLRTLEGQVPSLLQIEVGIDDLPQERSSQICLVTRFADRAGYEAYHHHPFHQALLEQFGPLVAEARKTDW